MRFAQSLRFFRRQASQSQEPDPADLGTAFGMEASLEPIDFHAPVAEYGLESQQVAAASPVDASPLAWLSRRS